LLLISLLMISMFFDAILFKPTSACNFTFGSALDSNNSSALARF